jgi:hypothetical protein
MSISKYNAFIPEEKKERKIIKTMNRNQLEEK